jgi:hypothetical protein
MTDGTNRTDGTNVSRGVREVEDGRLRCILSSRAAELCVFFAFQSFAVVIGIGVKGESKYDDKESGGLVRNLCQGDGTGEEVL